MADKIKITRQSIYEYYQAFDHFFPEGAPPNATSYLKWKTLKDFTDEIGELTGIDILSGNKKAINDSQQVLEALITTEVQGNMPGIDKLKNMEEAKEKQPSEKEIAQKIKSEVETALERQKEIYEKESQKIKLVSEELKKKSIYIKAENKTPERTKEVEVLAQQAKANPQETAAQIEKTTRERLPSAPEMAAKQAVYDIVQNLQTDNALLVRSSVEISLATNPVLVDSVIKNKILANSVNNWTIVLSDQKLTSIELSQAITKAAFGEAFQKEVLPDFIISFSDTPKEGFQEFHLDRISNDYSSLMDQQSFFLDGLKGFSVDQVKSQISLKVNSFLVGQIEKLPADSAIRVAFDSKIVQSCLPGIRMAAPAAWEAVEGSFFGKIAVSSGFAPALGWLGEKTGVDFGIKKITQVAVEKGIEGATGVGLAASITAAFAWTGPLAPAIGALGAFLIETIGAKIIGNAIKVVKDNAQKYGKFIVAGVGAVFGFILGGGSILGTLAGGAIGFGGATVIAGGLPALGATAASVGSAVVSFFGAVASATLGAIAIPIIATLIGLPILVAFILVIINNSAYVVPPSFSSLSEQNQYISVTKTANPAGPFQNSDLPLKISYTITIVAKKDDLTNVVVKDDCSATTKSSSFACTAPPIAVPDGAINVGSPFTFTYEVNYDTSYKDSLVINTVSVSANTLTAGKQQTNGSAVVIIGNPPTECFKFDDSWNKISNGQTGIANVSKAITSMRAASVYMQTLCGSAKQITLSYSTKSVNYGGEIINGGITLYKNGVFLSDLVTLYTLAHESGHIYAIHTGIDTQFADDLGVRAEGFLCTYPLQPSTGEDFAETIALYISKKAGSTKANCLGNFKTDKPKHWNFAFQNIFKQTLGW